MTNKDPQLNNLLLKLSSFDLQDWLGIITIVMQTSNQTEAEISIPALDRIGLQEGYLVLEGLENGGFKFIMLSHAEAAAIMKEDSNIVTEIIPKSRTLQ